MRVSLVLVLLVACRTGAKDAADDTAEPALTCPRGDAGELPPGDVNGDGHLDLADAVGLLRYVAAAGPAPVCPDSVDVVPDGFVELDDAFGYLLYLYEGGFGMLATPCTGEPWVAPECADVAAGIEVPDDTLAPFEARVTLRADVPVEAWSLSVQAEGCSITAATTLGTAGASVVDDPPGYRDLGYDATFLAEGGAVSAVVLDFLGPVALPVGEPAAVLALSVDAEGSCECTLRVGPALTALGQPVEALAVAQGAAWPLEASVTVATCAR